MVKRTKDMVPAPSDQNVLMAITAIDRRVRANLAKHEGVRGPPGRDLLTIEHEAVDVAAVAAEIAAIALTMHTLNEEP